MSNGGGSETQAPYRRAESELKRMQRGLARKVKGSNNRRKWRMRIARKHERIANIRSDFLHKFSRETVDAYSIICVEDLSLQGLARTRMAKSFHDAAIGKAVTLLEEKAAGRGGIVQKVDRFFPSTKRCHVCGYINDELSLSDREWTCPQCGARHERDVNAAINLEMEGVSLLAGSGYLGITTVEFAASGLGATSAQVVDNEAVRK